MQLLYHELHVILQDTVGSLSEDQTRSSDILEGAFSEGGQALNFQVPECPCKVATSTLLQSYLRLWGHSTGIFLTQAFRNLGKKVPLWSPLRIPLIRPLLPLRTMWEAGIVSWCSLFHQLTILPSYAWSDLEKCVCVCVREIKKMVACTATYPWCEFIPLAGSWNVVVLIFVLCWLALCIVCELSWDPGAVNFQLYTMSAVQLAWSKKRSISG